MGLVLRPWSSEAPSRVPFRRMAIAAMAEAFDKISAAIPFVRLFWVGLNGAGAKIERVPGPETCTNSKGNISRFGFDWSINAADRFQEDPDGKHVIPRYFGEPLVWERRIEILALAPDTLVHRAIEFVVRPSPDPMNGVGVRFWRVEGANGK